MSKKCIQYLGRVMVKLNVYVLYVLYCVSRVCTSYSSGELSVCRAIYVLGDILKSYTGELLILGAILGSS